MTPAAFNTAAEAFMAALGTWATELDAALTALNAALGWTTIETIRPAARAMGQRLLPTTYNDLLIMPKGVSFTASANLNMAIGDGASSFATAQTVSAGNTGASDAFYGGILIPGYNKDGGIYIGGATPLANRSTGAPGFLGRSWRMDGGIKYLRFTPTTGNGDAGQILVYGFS
jgi:hypothetical protein